MTYDVILYQTLYQTMSADPFDINQGDITQKSLLLPPPPDAPPPKRKSGLLV